MNTLPEELSRVLKEVAVGQDARKKLGSLFFQLRLDFNLKQAALAEIMGISQPLLSQIEQGSRLPNVTACEKLLAFLGSLEAPGKPKRTQMEMQGPPTGGDKLTFG